MPGQVARPVALSTVQSMPNDTWPLRLYWPCAAPLGLAVFKIDLVGYPFGATFSLGTSFSCCFVCKHFVTSMVRWPASAALTRDFSLFRKPLPLFGRSTTPFTSPSPNGYRGNFSEAWSHPGAPEVYTPNGDKGVCGNRTPHNPCLCSQLSQNDNRGTAKIHIQQANKVATSRTPEPVFLDALHGSLPDVPSDPYFIATSDANKLQRMPLTGQACQLPPPSGTRLATARAFMKTLRKDLLACLARPPCGRGSPCETTCLTCKNLTRHQLQHGEHAKARHVQQQQN